jgi:hypothetical protein
MSRKPTAPPDNGKVHYGQRLRGTICGCEASPRLESASRDDVTCPECLILLKGRPSMIDLNTLATRRNLP